MMNNYFKKIGVGYVEYLKKNGARKNAFMSTTVSQDIFHSGQVKNNTALLVKVLYMNRTGSLNLYVFWIC